MQIQILSDLHLEIERATTAPGQEFYHYNIPANSDTLVLLGDIGWTTEPRLFEWLELQLRKFQTIFFVSGNHEPYRSSIDDSHQRLREFSTKVNANSSLGSFFLLDRTRHDISPTLTILGCSLWSALNQDDLDILSWSLTDFRRIGEFNPTVHSALHKADLTWLNETVSSMVQHEPERQIVIFTHHAPTKEGTGSPQYADGPTSSAFASELTGEACWASGHVKLWAFVHTHWCCDFERNGVRLYSNQRGYGEGQASYDAGKVVEI
ncbi:Ser/Thr protein phosphatase protein [Rhodocollybia butyracea]|uniref:Ser/Thr protein phosphatase protein n=1 Tax=Rhodocollybia butyracea TaxID=206335 RepID=A0A9P5PG45_9AGAR|nr:Ser/Thr protein phosphatase protein [Rhodocollybia butyracea]